MSTLATRTTSRALSNITLAIAAGLSAAAATAAQPYRITDLGEYHVPKALNDRGQVTGLRLNDYLPILGFVYTPGSGLLHLPSLEPAAINDHGVLAGTHRPRPGPIHAFRYDLKTGVLEDIAIGNGEGRAAGINNAGQVVGAFRPPGVFETTAFLANRGSPPVLLGALPGDNASSAIAINDAGAVIGSSGGSSFVWTASAGMTELDVTYVVAINNTGQMAGYLDESEPSDYDEGIPLGEAFLYTPGSGALRLGRADALGSSPSGINDAGDVVGTLHYSFTAGISPFLYTAADGMVGLSSLLSPADEAKWNLQRAVDINNKGQIIGVANIGEVPHGFLLTPVPEPGTYALMLAGLAALGVVRWRRRASPATAVPA